MKSTNSDEEIEIAVLDESNFLDYMKKNNHVVVMFMSPYCPHCRKTKPQFKRAALLLKGNSIVSFVEVDCTVSVDLCRDNDVEVYPVIKYFNYSSRQEDTFVGKRTAENIVAFVEQYINKK